MTGQRGIVLALPVTSTEALAERRGLKRKRGEDFSALIKAPLSKGSWRRRRLRGLSPLSRLFYNPLTATLRFAELPLAKGSLDKGFAIKA